MINILFIYLLIINAAAFLLMLADKHRARKKAWRIPEATLLTAAAIGGSIGAILGMYIFRHKTRHPKFSVGLPLILSAQVLLFVFLFIEGSAFLHT